MEQRARNNWLFKILLLCASIVAFLVAAELILRVLPESILGFSYKKYSAIPS